MVGAGKIDQQLFGILKRVVAVVHPTASLALLFEVIVEFVVDVVTLGVGSPTTRIFGTPAIGNAILDHLGELGLLLRG